MEQQVVQGVQETSFFLFAYESIKYILSKNIEQKEQKTQIEELGYHLGERAAHFLMTTKSFEQTQTIKSNEQTQTIKSNEQTQASQINIELEKIMKFLAKEVWIFISGSPMQKLRKNSRGAFILELDDIKLHSCLMTEKGNVKDDKLKCIFWFLTGVIKGVVNSFNYECTVTYNINPLADQKETFSYTFSIQILNLNIK